ncbi:MAG: transposase family protein, partial [Thermodesulfobacteriota bacterium]|nr:transposase family protein [Thermodesulfobacteriota bacterium]
MSIATLSDWDKLFDPDMVPYRKPEKRGKAAKVTIEIVRSIVTKAREIQAKGKKIRIKQFCRTVRDELAIELGRKTVQEILVANDLYAPSTRIRRPRFYRNICRRIPNGLLSLDGSEFVVTIDDRPYKFNLELGVDVGSFCHTGFDIRQAETSQAVIAVLEEHQKNYGLPLGVLFDHGSANMSEDVAKWLQDNGVERVPVGPGNPKGNGTDEGAFSQMKSVLGSMNVRTSSPEELGKDILNMLVSVYTRMRNKLSLRRAFASPE